ncbi:hypothetical protein N7E81_18430 [Reichenbachiella carrageenanivorans]|uniref:MFS transporter n=1 Tax=Reichenbachiella carrageenanivorans TaxID=2979869 RepID=A0ABY6D2N0_9BACT|nr:hypothetical protein [Reichenbachiella carrageenanivorans]UXX79333.1 hypothetical protein N7E81_18430 [Reichenbachiella carrageenanivorans]
MSDLPSYVSGVFLATVAATFGFLYYGIKLAQRKKSNTHAIAVSTFMMVWLFLIAALSLNDFFLAFEAMPPRFVFVLLPPMISIFLILAIKRSRDFVRRMPITTLTYLHIVRVPVEIVLWWLAIHQWVPKLLTFEGINYDILSGVSAPFAAIFMVSLRSKSRIGAILWNCITLALLVNIVGHALLAAPSPFQQFAFDQPNVAVFHFPFIWLPGFIVPAVLFAHLVSLMKLFDTETELV